LLDPTTGSPPASAVIDRLIAAGVEFVLVTGRPPRWIPPVLAELAVARLRSARTGPCSTMPSPTPCSGRGRCSPRPSSRSPRPPRGPARLGLAVERVGATADGLVGDQFIAEPAYVHAWPNPDHASVERAELLTLPAIKMLARAPGLSSDAMVAALTPVVGHLRTSRSPTRAASWRCRHRG
jgi:hypothetical protein